VDPCSRGTERRRDSIYRIVRGGGRGNTVIARPKKLSGLTMIYNEVVKDFNPAALPQQGPPGHRGRCRSSSLSASS
jgi:hypothetical protein